MKFSEYNVLINEPEGLFLINTISGAIFKINDDIKEIIESDNIGLLNQEDINKYKDRGVIVDQSLNELQMLIHNQNVTKFKSEVLSLTLLMTSDCNFKCVYCFEGLEKEKRYLESELKESIQNLIRNVLNSNKNIKMVSITLFGGEPLIRFNDNYDFLRSIQNECNNMDVKFKTDIVTNGALITNEILDKLKELNCENIQITLDGMKEIHDIRRMNHDGKGTFDIVVKSIKTVVDYEYLKNPVIRINIDKENLDSTVELLDYLKEVGLSGCFIDLGIIRDANEVIGCNNSCIAEDDLGDIVEPLWNEMNIRGFNYTAVPIRRSIYCGLCNEMSFTIDPKGDIYKCWEMVGKKDFLIGKLSNDGNINNLSSHYFEWMNRGIENIDDCKTCKYLPLCGCGCASVSYQNNGTILSSGCFKTKSIFKNQFLHLYKNGMIS